MLSHSVQNFKTIWQLGNTLWIKEISRGLSLGWIKSDIWYCNRPPVVGFHVDEFEEIVGSIFVLQIMKMARQPGSHSLHQQGRSSKTNGHVWNHHDDVIKWKHFSRYCPFVRGIHRSPVNSHQCRGALMFSLIYALNKRLSKQSWDWWFETPASCLLWRHCNEI